MPEEFDLEEHLMSNPLEDEETTEEEGETEEEPVEEEDENL